MQEETKRPAMLKQSYKKQKRKKSISKLDGGCLAWTVVASSFMLSFVLDGFRSSTMCHLKKILCATSDHKNNSFFPPPWAAYWGCSISTALLLAFSLKTLHLPATPLASSCPPLPIISKLVAPRQRSPPQFLNFSSLDQVGITVQWNRFLFTYFDFLQTTHRPSKKKIKTQSFCNVAKNIHCISFNICLWLIFSLSQDHWLQPC